MIKFTPTEAKQRAKIHLGRQYNFSANAALNEQVTKQASISSFDIFLSHSFEDKEIILGVTLLLEDMGFKVYLDWRDDAGLSRSQVSKETARILRRRMRESRCLLYATTSNSSNSKWMPWELGYKDGLDSRCAILPVIESNQNKFKGQEYLGLYPYINKELIKGSQKEALWVHDSYTKYIIFDRWLNDEKPYTRK